MTEPARPDAMLAGPAAGAPPPDAPSPRPGPDAGTAVLDYKVSLENFYGPLDLLLHLVKEKELSIETIAIASVAEQYCVYLDMMQSLDINLAGEFLVMAATLMAIKARALVPREAIEEEEDEDPSLDLIRKLIEYKRFKERARRLGLLAEARARRFSRGLPAAIGEAPTGDAAAGAEPTVELELWPLVSAFARLTRQIRLDVPMSILYADVPIERFMTMVMERLRQAGALGFAELAGTSDKMKVIGTFLAVLHLAKDQLVAVEQVEAGGEMRVVLTEGAGPSPTAAPDAASSPAAAPEAEPAETRAPAPDAPPPAGTSDAPEPTKATDVKSAEEEVHRADEG